MKKNIFLIATLCAVLIFAGCRKESKNNRPLGTVERPSWSISDDYDYSSSMTAIVRVDIYNPGIAYSDAKTFSDNDLLAAFCNNVCIGVAEPEDDLFYLYIIPPEGEATSKMITLRYYSDALQCIFEAKDVFEYMSDARYGTVSEPFNPLFTLVSAK